MGRFNHVNWSALGLSSSSGTPNSPMWFTDAWFRGTVSTFSSGSTVGTGYAKSYNYNRALRYREPPYFIAPTESAWKIVRQNEQVPAR
jgi:hypothetical protein